jgi:hypothetical protein
MPRIRTIKPEFPQSESMGRVSRDARLTFIQLWTLADDSGRLRGNSRMLASLLFPYDLDAGGLIDKWLDELDAEGCIVRYKVGSDSYIEIAKWLIHQKIDKPSASKNPAPSEGSRILANPREHSSLDQGSRTKDQGAKDQVPKEREETNIQQTAGPVGPRVANSPRFDALWTVYPRKVGKDAARKAFDKRKPDDALVAQMIQAVTVQRASPQWLKDGGQFIPHLSTWLNDGRWQDEPERAPQFAQPLFPSIAKGAAIEAHNNAVAQRILERMEREQRGNHDTE